MNIREYIKAYGTHTTSAFIKQMATNIPDSEAKQILVEMADSLQSALIDYASEDFEPPTVNNEVV